MDAIESGIFYSFLEMQRAALVESVQASYDAVLGKKTGKLYKSIHALAAQPRETGDKIITEVSVMAGGMKAGAYYGWFLEFGTGVYTLKSSYAQEGYLGKGFNELRPPGGSGWEIVGRSEGPYPGKFISHGIKPKHWFYKGAQAGFAKVAAINAQLDFALGDLRSVGVLAQRIAKSIVNG